MVDTVLKVNFFLQETFAYLGSFGAKKKKRESCRELGETSYAVVTNASVVKTYPIGCLYIYRQDCIKHIGELT